MGDVYELKIFLTSPRSGLCMNVQHFDAGTIVDTDTPYEGAKALCTAWATANSSNLRDCLGTDVVLQALAAKRIYSSGGPTATEILNLNGTGPDQMEVSGVAANGTLYPDAAPYNEGHQYIGPTYKSAIGNNVWNSEFVTTVGEYLAGLLLPLSVTVPFATNFSIGIWNRKTHALRPVAETGLVPKPTAMNRRFKPYS